MATKRILVPACGGSPALNYIRSLQAAPEAIEIVGVDCDKYALARSPLGEKHLVPPAKDPAYLPVLQDVIRQTGAQFIHLQNDTELAFVSERREELPVRHFFPPKETVRACIDKFESYRRWTAVGIPQPRTRFLETPEDLDAAFAEFGAPLWVRATVGAAGKGSLMVHDVSTARSWIDFNKGWGSFTAAEYLSPQSVTWQSIWKDGALVVAQGRKRLYWEFANRAPSGITGLTGTGVTMSDPTIDAIAQRAIMAIDPKPHGIFSVDLTYDRAGVPNPTEINIGRFFTTHEFFTRAGLNMPYIALRIAFGEEPTLPAQRLNPLPPGLAWVRGLDFLPTLTDERRIDAAEGELAARVKNLGLA